MTEQEAIAIIKKNYPKCCKMVNGRYKGGFDDTDCELGQAFNITINALEEVQQYRAIGKVSTCRNAVELCRAMIERGIEPDNIKEYIKFEDNLVQRGYDLKRFLEMMEEHKQYREIGTPEECLRNKDFLDFLSDKMNPNDFETYLRLYNALEEKGCEE